MGNFMGGKGSKYEQYIVNDTDKIVEVEWGQGLPYPNNPPQPLEPGETIKMVMLRDDQWFPKDYQFPEACVKPEPDTEFAQTWDKIDDKGKERRYKSCRRQLALPGTYNGKPQTYKVSTILDEGAITPAWEIKRKRPEFGVMHYFGDPKKYDKHQYLALECRVEYAVPGVLALAFFMLVGLRKSRGVREPVQVLQWPLMHA